MGYEIFISYSNVDKVIADAICSHLEAERFRCWIAPRDVMAGRVWAESIVEALNQVSIMVLVLSQNSNSSKQVVLEVERAVAKGISIFPFRIEDCKPTLAMEYFVSSAHWLDAIDPPVEAHIRKLVVAIRGLVSLGRPTPPPPQHADVASDQKFVREFQEIAPDDWNRGSQNFITRFFRNLLDER